VLAERVADTIRPALGGRAALLLDRPDRSRARGYYTNFAMRITAGDSAIELERRHLDLARDISAVARSHGAVADRAAAQEVQLAIAAKPDDSEVGFWRAALGYAPLAEDNAVDRLGHGSTVWMQDLDEAKPLRHAMHVDVSVAREHVEERVEAALAAGGRVVDESGAPAHWILSDRAGNRVCICAWPDGATSPALDGPVGI
jgi:4a-hydroxytetrahydrobiopterin dehydratase